jgi:hypothetical protein
VLRLPETHPPADPGYDAAIIAAHAAASRRSSQPVRLLLQVNPWLSRSQVRDQLRAARARMAERIAADVTTTGAPQPDPDPAPPQPAPQLPLLSLDDTERAERLREAHRLTGRWMLPTDVVMYGMAPDSEHAQRLLDVARRGHSGT